MTNKNSLINDALCRQLVRDFFSQTRKGDSAANVVTRIIRTVYAQGHQAGLGSKEKVDG